MAAALVPVNPTLDVARDGLAGASNARHLPQMASKDKEREERLAAALRENLRRRKAQSRATRDEGSDEPAD